MFSPLLLDEVDSYKNPFKGPIEPKYMVTVEQIKQQIASRNAKWQPVETTRGEVPKYSLGCTIDEQHVRAARTRAATNIEEVIADFGKATRGAGAPPAHVDWREQNKVTPVKDQRQCGSCVSFGTIGTLESMVLIEQNVERDLSEAELFYCGGAGDASCEGGWFPPRAFPYLHTKGVANESCFPYQDHNIPCNVCADRDQQAVKIRKDVELMPVNDRKQYLSRVGPLIGAMDVYDDFFSYASGVYSHVTGDLAGGHCVQIVGYDDNEGAWICKNSWTTGWGDNGFFKMAYEDRDCKMDTEYPMWGMYGTG
jgi:C1A family cysteine protease